MNALLKYFIQFLPSRINGAVGQVAQAQLIPVGKAQVTKAYKPIPTKKHKPKPIKVRKPQRAKVYYEGDRMAVVCFHGQAYILKGLTSPLDPSLFGVINGLPNHLGSYTNMAAGLSKGYQILSKSPRGTNRRIYLLSDGESDLSSIQPVVDKCIQARININTIAFASSIGKDILKSIANQTHNGQFFFARNLIELTDAIVPRPKANSSKVKNPEHTVFICDVSWSMNENLEGRRRIDAVVQALHGLLKYKQQFA